MPDSLIPQQGFEGQQDWSGGLVLIGEPGPTQYADSLNVEVRNGPVETRRGIRGVLRNGQCVSFFFNEENAKFNDATHTGFFFDWDWGVGLSLPIQGIEYVRFPKIGPDGSAFFIIVANGSVFILENGFLEVISTSDTIATDEVIEFVQAGAGGNLAGQGVDFVVMFRGEDKAPLRWDGSDTGFVAFPAGSPNSIENSSFGIYAAGRLWEFRDKDDVFVSDIFDITSWDRIDQFFSIRKGDGDELVAMTLFHNDTVLMWKRRSIDVVTGITSGPPFVGGITVTAVENKHGLIAKDSIIVSGEQIWYWSDRGVENIQRNNENNLRGQDFSVSASIQPIIDRINKTAQSRITGVAFDNYLLWGVPVDNSPTNNAILVWDILANGGRGNWIGLWQSKQTIPNKFFVVDDKLLFFGEDALMREMFTNDPWDSENVFQDTPAHDIATDYVIGDLVVNDSFSETTIFRCVLQNTNEAPPNTQFWEEILDPQHIYDIMSSIRTREYRHGDTFSEKRRGNQEIIIEHQNPSLEISIKNKDYQTDTVLFTGKQYRQTVYDSTNGGFNIPDWDASNVNLDFRRAHRQDYTVFLTPGGLLIDATGEDLTDPFFIAQEGIIIDETGIDLNIFETHALRFIRPLMNNHEYQLIITNTGGRMRLRSIGSMARLVRYGAKER